MVYKLSEFQDQGKGYWHCVCVEGLGHSAAQWFVPARILGLSPAAYVKYIIDNFKPDDIYINKEKCLVFFSWKKQSDMRKWKNFINAKAREKNFQI